MAILTDEQRKFTGIHLNNNSTQILDIREFFSIVPCATLDDRLINYVNNNLYQYPIINLPELSERQNEYLSEYFGANFKITKEIYCIDNTTPYRYITNYGLSSGTPGPYLVDYVLNGEGEFFLPSNYSGGLNITENIADDKIVRVRTGSNTGYNSFVPESLQPQLDYDYSKICLAVDLGRYTAPENWLKPDTTADIPTFLTNEHPEGTAILHIAPLFNNEDGSYSSTNQRRYVNGSGTTSSTAQLCVIAETEYLPIYTSIETGSEATEYTGKIQVMFPLNMILGGLSYISDDVFTAPFYKYFIPVWNAYEPLYLTTEGCCLESGNYEAKTVLFGTYAELSRLIDMFGLPWTNNREQALSSNTVEFTRPTPAPPLPDIPGPGPGPEPGGDSPGTGGNTPSQPGQQGGIGSGDERDDIPGRPSTTGTLASGGHTYAISRAYISTLRQALNTTEIGEFTSLLFKGDPTQAIINLIRFPFVIDNVTSVAANTNISIAGTDVYYISNVSRIYPMGGEMTGTGSATIPMGSFTLQEYFASFMDYAPYTSVTLFLPYIGFRDLDTNLCMGRTMALRYIASFADGSLTAILEIDGQDMYTWTGQIGTMVPMSTNNSMSKAQTVLGSVLASGVTGAVGAAMGNPIAAGAAAASAVQNVASTALAPTQLHNKGTAMTNSGDYTSNTPYLIITRPVTWVPSNFGEIDGYLTDTYANLGELSGFTACADVKLNFSATQAEKDEIRQLLESGVIL